MNSASQARETPLESFKTASKDMKRERDDEQHLVEQYFSDVRKKPLLTREQEIALAKKKDEGYQARKELITGSFLTREQGNALAKKIDAGDEARKELTEHNLRFVISKARKFTGCGLPLPDLIQEGNIALIEAVNSYEWEKGRLTTYASRNIEWKINRAIAEQSGIIRIPEYEQRELHKFERAKEKLSEGARDLSDLEIGNKIGIKQDKVEDLTALSKRTIISLTLSRREEDNNTVLQDTIPSKNPDVEEVVYSQEQNRLLMEGLHTLHTVDKRAEEIMIKRYGLDRQGDMSLSEVGEIFGVSRERVRQIEQEATVKLRRNKTLKALAEEIRKGEDALEQKTEAIRKGQETTWLNKTLTCEERVEKRREYQREYMIHYHEKRRKQRAILAQREQEQNEAIQISPLTLSQKA